MNSQPAQAEEERGVRAGASTMSYALPRTEAMRIEAELAETRQMLMRLHLEAAVPLAIHDLAKLGGPSDWHWDRTREFADDLGGGGDALLYREKGKTGKMMSKLIEGIAVLAFQPGGITFLGLHFDASKYTQQEQA